MSAVELQAGAGGSHDEKYDFDGDYRLKLIQEFASAEEANVAVLKACKEMHKEARALFSENQARVVFSEFDEILPQAENFAKAVKERADAWKQNPKIGDVFLANSGYISAFNRYVTESEESAKLVRELSANGDQFANDVAKVMKQDGAAAGIALDVSLVLPMASVTRYKVFLSDIRHHTEAKDEDYNDVVSADKAINEIIKKISLAIKISSGRREVQKIEYGFDGSIDLATADRYLDARTRIVVKIFKSIRELEMFVFNDMILFASGTGSNLTPWREEYRFKFSDDSFHVEDLQDGTKFEDETADAPAATESYHMTMESEFGGFGSFEEPISEAEKEDDFLLNNFRLVTRDLKVVVHCELTEEKARWMKIIRNCKEQLNGNKTGIAAV
jgi:hypothetical protein